MSFLYVFKGGPPKRDRRARRLAVSPRISAAPATPARLGAEMAMGPPVAGKRSPALTARNCRPAAHRARRGMQRRRHCALTDRANRQARSDRALPY